MLIKQEQDFLDNFKTQMEIAEFKQVQELGQYCDNRYQFAKTHSVYVKDWEKTKTNMIKKMEQNQFSSTLSRVVVEEMIKISDSVMQEKLAMVRLIFEKKFGESIYNFLGKDGKTKKLFGIFG